MTQLRCLKKKSDAEIPPADERWKGGFPGMVFLYPARHPAAQYWCGSVLPDSKAKNLHSCADEASQ